MIQQRALLSARLDPRPKWFNSPVRVHKGKLPEMRPHLPAFERRGFALTQPGSERSRLNEHLDTIVRLPIGDDPNFVPVGVVSKDYALVPHTAVLDVATEALKAAEMPIADVDAELTLTEYGERMALSLFLPEKFNFDPGDGHPMALRLECLNSVDGSTRFRAVMGWLRFVCTNGLVVGVTRADVCRRHVGDLYLDRVRTVLAAGLQEAENDERRFRRWSKKRITLDRLSPWTEKEVRKGWGFKAAARTFHIARCGNDVELVGAYKGKTPTTIPVRETRPVPGAPRQSQNLFDVSQILAWLAQERRDLQERLEWREQIPALLKSLN